MNLKMMSKIYVKLHHKKQLQQKKYQEYWDHYSVNKLSKEYARLTQAQFQPNEEFLQKYRESLKQNMTECANYHLIWYQLYSEFHNNKFWPIFQKLFQYIEPISNKMSNFLNPGGNTNNDDFDMWLQKQFYTYQISTQSMNRQQSNLFTPFTPSMGPTSFASRQNLYDDDGGGSSRNNARIKNKYQYDDEFDENNKNKDDEDDDEDDDENDDNDEFGDRRDDDDDNNKKKKEKKSKTSKTSKQ